MEDLVLYGKRNQDITPPTPIMTIAQDLNTGIGKGTLGNKVSHNLLHTQETPFQKFNSVHKTSKKKVEATSPQK